MHFDDRLATVLRLRASGERAAKTQFRQLIDLLGERAEGGDSALEAAAYLRLIALADEIPLQERVALVGEHGWRFRNPDLVKWFAEEHPHIAAAALSRAQLTPDEWVELIPALPIRSRGFLRYRKDLPLEAMRVLDQLGVSDRALPLPEPAQEVPKREAPAAPAPAASAQPAKDPAKTLPGKDDVKALLARIEAFSQERTPPSPTGVPTKPRTRRERPRPPEYLDHFFFKANSEGRIEWAEAAILPMVFGIDLKKLGSGRTVEAIARRKQMRDTLVALRGAPLIEGDWVVDANPRFDTGNGRFLGYEGLFRRPVDAGDPNGEQADRLRQLLHELRTPVNAMQGYAEMIQQQVIGPVPHEYRSIAATIAGDAAHILAGLEELERLARLEAGSIELEPGTCDFAQVARSQLAQLQSVLRPKVARIEADFGHLRTPVGLAETEAERLAWRMLATLAGSVAAGETIKIDLATEGSQLELAADIPAILRDPVDIFAVEARSGSGALSAGIFGIGFSLRLARAEARSAGGDLVRHDGCLVLSLPLRVAANRVSIPQNAEG